MSSWNSDNAANRLHPIFINGFLDISGGDMTIRHGDISLNDVDISVNNTASFTNMDAFNNDISMSKLLVNNDVSMGDVSLNIVGDLSLDGTLSVGSLKNASIDLNAIIHKSHFNKTILQCMKCKPVYINSESVIFQ